LPPYRGGKLGYHPLEEGPHDLCINKMWFPCIFMKIEIKEQKGNIFTVNDGGLDKKIGLVNRDLSLHPTCLDYFSDYHRFLPR